MDTKEVPKAIEAYAAADPVFPQEEKSAAEKEASACKAKSQEQTEATPLASVTDKPLEVPPDIPPSAASELPKEEGACGDAVNEASASAVKKENTVKPPKVKKKRRNLFSFKRTPTKSQSGAVILGALISAFAATGFLMGAVYSYSYTDYIASYLLFAAIVPFAAGLIISLSYYASMLRMPLSPSRKPARQKRNRVLMYIVPMLIAVILTTGSGMGFSYLSELEVADLAFITSAQEKKEFETIGARYEESLWGTPDPAQANLIAEDLLEASEGLYFKDISYKDTRKSNWQTLKHLERLYAMMRYYGKDLIASDTAIRDQVIGILNYWLNKNFTSADERANKIDTPRYLSDIGSMLKPYLSVNQTGRMKSIIKKGSLSIAYFNGTGKWKGAFLAEAALNSIRYSFFANKPYLFKKAVARINDAIVITTGNTEGIKPDYTFYQNGAQSATAGYGTVFFCDASAIAGMCEGSSFQLAGEKLSILTDFALYGQRYAYRGMNSSHLTNGLFYSRNGGNSAVELKSAIGILLSIDRTPKKEELQSFYLSFDDLSYAPDDTKYVSYSRTLYDISPDYYMAVKGAYASFISSELINGENILARNLSYGGMTLYEYTGAEYENMSALWDFSMIPGTTAFNEGDEMLAAYPDNDDKYFYGSTTTHSGGNADGAAGGLYVDIVNEDGLYCRQAYISYNGMMVCLGTALTCSNSYNTKTVYTSVNQTYSVDTSFKGTPMKVSSKIEDDLPSKITKYVNDNAAVYNGAFAYYNLCESQLTATAVAVTGSLYRNNPDELGGSTENMFKLYYDFGTMPVNQSFAYAVRANSLGDAPETAEGLPIVNMVNHSSIQAVEYADGTAIVIFHTAGSYTTLRGQTLNAGSEGVQIIRAE